MIDGLEIHPFQSIRSNPPLSLILWLTITVDPFAFRSIKEEDVRKHTHKPPIEQSIEKRKGKRETLGMDLRIEIKIKTHTDRQRGARDRFVVGGVWEWKDFVQRVCVLTAIPTAVVMSPSETVSQGLDEEVLVGPRLPSTADPLVVLDQHIESV